MVELFQDYKVPQRIIANKIGMRFSKFRKKLYESGSTFTDEEKEVVKSAISDYLQSIKDSLEKVE